MESTISSLINLEYGLYLALTAFIGWLMLQFRSAFWLFSLLALPGTLAHELCHWFTALLTGSNPGKLSIIPKRRGAYYQLGSVEMTGLSWYNAWLVALSPLLLLPLSLYLIEWRLSVLDGPLLELVWVYLIASLLLASLPSKQDFKVAIQYSGWAALSLLLLLGGYLVWQWLGANQG